MRYMRRIPYQFAALAGCILLFSGLWSAPASARGSLIDLGVLPGYTSSPVTGVSANGKVVIGILSGEEGKNHAFRWTREKGMTDLGTLPGGSWSKPYAVSPDGTVVVGEADDINGAVHIFRWTRKKVDKADEGEGHSHHLSRARNAGMTDITGATAYAGGSRYTVSNDGKLITGSSGSAFRWTPKTGIVWDFSGSSANVISADGKVAFMSCYSGSTSTICRWTEATGWVPIDAGPITGSIDLSIYSGEFSVIDLSADGKVMTGLFNYLDFSSYSSYGEPLGCSTSFKWSESGGMEAIGGGCDFTYSQPLAVSLDGSAIVGRAQEGHSYSGNYIFRNGENIGTFSAEINEQIQALFFEFTAVSADGNTILGSGGGNLGSPFYWNQAVGMRTISQWLIDNGVDVYKWLVDEGPEINDLIANIGIDVRFLDPYFFTPFSVCADGNVIVGTLPFNGHAFWAQADRRECKVLGAKHHF